MFPVGDEAPAENRWRASVFVSFLAIPNERFDIDNDSDEQGREFLRQLVSIDPHVSTEDDPPWYEPGELYEIDEETYWYFLELFRLAGSMGTGLLSAKAPARSASTTKALAATSRVNSRTKKRVRSAS